MKQWIVYFLFALTFMSCCGGGLAQDLTNGKTLFNLQSANQQFTAITKQLSTKGQKLTVLVSAVNQLEDLNDKAEECVSIASKKLKTLNELLKSIEPTYFGESQQLDLKYLQEKRKFFSQQLSDCRYFLYRSQEELVAHKDTILQLSTVKLFKRSTPIWKIHEKQTLTSIQDIDFKQIYNDSGFSELSMWNILLGLGLIFISILAGIYIRALAKRWLRQKHNIHSAFVALVAIIAVYITPLIIFGTLTGYFAILYLDKPFSSSLELISYALFIYVALLAAAKYFFTPPLGAISPLKLPTEFGEKCFRRIVTLVSWILIGYICATIFADQSLELQLVDLARTLFITVLSILAMRFCWLISKFPKLQKKYHLTVLFLQLAFSGLLITMLATEWLGYHELAVYLITGVLLTVSLSLIAAIVWHFTSVLYQVLNNKQYTISKHIRRIFGLPPRRNFNEIALAKFACYIVILYVLLIMILQSWGVSANFIDTINDALFSGFSIGGLKIIPIRILIAIFIFMVVTLLGRLFAAVVGRKQRFTTEQDTQIALESLIKYIGFSIALLLALLVAGLNFTGLAIIAGALSVGIGLGLQDIVNNFFSGLILLLEKPVKPGDRVIVGDTEGYIQKVRLRSTQIKTLAQEDVIFPNSELITNKVTNYMFRDSKWRTVCQVGVAYGSDTELVQATLLEVAAQHPDVSQDLAYEPRVLFRSFGDSSLLFELWCIISDVNKKYRVTSELNFAIDKAFRKNGITIAFPQRDIHIRNPATPTTPT